MFMLLKNGLLCYNILLYKKRDDIYPYHFIDTTTSAKTVKEIQLNIFLTCSNALMAFKSAWKNKN